MLMIAYAGNSALTHFTDEKPEAWWTHSGLVDSPCLTSSPAVGPPSREQREADTRPLHASLGGPGSIPTLFVLSVRSECPRA